MLDSSSSFIIFLGFQTGTPFRKRSTDRCARGTWCEPTTRPCLAEPWNDSKQKPSGTTPPPFRSFFLSLSLSLCLSLSLSDSISFLVDQCYGLEMKIGRMEQLFSTIQRAEDSATNFREALELYFKAITISIRLLGLFVGWFLLCLCVCVCVCVCV